MQTDMVTDLSHLNLFAGFAFLLVWTLFGFLLGLAIQHVGKNKGIYRPQDRSLYAFLTLTIVTVGWGFRWLEFYLLFGKGLSDGGWPYVWHIGMAVGQFFGYSLTGHGPSVLMPLDRKRKPKGT